MSRSTGAGMTIVSPRLPTTEPTNRLVYLTNARRTCLDASVSRLTLLWATLCLGLATQHSDAAPRSSAKSTAIAPKDMSSSVDVATRSSGAQAEKAIIEISVEEAIRMALANSFDVKIASTGHRIRQREVAIERAEFDPFFFGGTDYSKNRKPTASFLDVGNTALQGVTNNPFETWSYHVGIGGKSWLGTLYSVELRHSALDQPLANQTIFGINPQEQVTATFEVTQPLLRGGWQQYNSARIRIAANDEQISQHDLKHRATEILYSVEVTYWRLSYAIKNYESKQKALQATNDYLAIVRTAHEAGAMSVSDLLSAKSQLALRKVELNESLVLVRDTRDRLLLLVNRGGGEESLKEKWRNGVLEPTFDDVWVIPTSEPDTTPMSPSRTQSLEIAFDQRADYRQLLLHDKSHRVGAQVAKNESLPDLNALFRWQQFGLDDDFGASYSSLGDGDFYGWTVGVELRFPLFNRGPKERYWQALDRISETNLRRRKLENQIVAQVDQSIRNLAAIQERLADLAERVELQNELLQQERDKLQLGNATVYNITLMENDLLESEALSLRAKSEYQAAKADYARAIGTLLSDRGVETMGTE